MIMGDSSTLEQELKELIINTLALEDMSPDDISSDVTLFGEGLGLDSIDALELGVALQKKYSVKVEADSEENRRHFSNVRNLALFVASQQAAQQQSK